MAGLHRQPDHTKGDANTIGGYAAVHERPAAFEGPDGMSYSVELLTDETGDPARPYGGYLFFVRWRRFGEPGVDGHLESAFLRYGATPDEALDAVRALPLQEVRALLHEMVAERAGGGAPRRKWWDAMRDPRE